MKSPRKTKNNITFDPKSTKEVKEQPKKEQVNTKDKEKEAQFQKLEEYVNESGLSLAFNIIFAELISKQILPENFFTYTSMRLKQIGKEIEGLKTKESIFVDENEEEKKIEDQGDEQPQEKEVLPPQEENKEDLFMTRPQQAQQPLKAQNQQSKGTQQKNQKKKK